MRVRKYVTSFPGKRDAYQIPYTLFKNNRLDFFLTDFYNKKWLSKIPIKKIKLKLKERQVENLPHNLVKAYPIIPLLQTTLNRFISPAKSSVITDDMYAKAAVKYCSRYKSNLLLYEFQAEYAFKQKMNHHPVKIVFYFHPHPSFDHPILLDDSAKYPAYKNQVLQSTRLNLSQYYRDHTKTAWKNADHIIVASSFTKKSLCEIGASEENITVCPYGVSVQEKYAPVLENPGDPYFLYVGSGIHRKGLHHLLHAWNSSKLKDIGKLIVVARHADDYNTQLLRDTPNVIWKRGVSRSELIQLYANASLFVLPSLSEGFGQVYIEALSFGCPVLGTNNSVLTDIKGFDDVIFKVQPGNVDELREMLETLWVMQPGFDRRLRNKAASIRDSFTWTNFQDRIENVLKKFD